jgi:hypothetical protein
MDSRRLHLLDEMGFIDKVQDHEKWRLVWNPVSILLSRCISLIPTPLPWRTMKLTEFQFSYRDVFH